MADSLREVSDTDHQTSLLAQTMQLPMKDVEMFIDALPNQLNDVTPRAIYVTEKSQTVPTQLIAQINKLGVCGAYQANEEKEIYPMIDAEQYQLRYKKGPSVLYKQGTDMVTDMSTVIEVLRKPKYGKLELKEPDAEFGDFRKYHYKYISNKDYEGLDEFEFKVSVKDKELRILYQVKVYGEGDSPKYENLCESKKWFWKIAPAGKPDGFTGDLAAWQRSTVTNEDDSRIYLVDLTGVFARAPFFAWGPSWKALCVTNASCRTGESATPFASVSSPTSGRR